MAYILAADVIYTADGGDATTDTEVKSEQNCSHRWFFGSRVLRTLLAAWTLAMSKFALSF
jgi:hypothetical protein